MSRDVFKVLGIAGSLRHGSYNRGLLRAAQKLAPEGVHIEAFDLANIPPYNADVEAQGLPEPVRQFKDRLSEANALLIATPEYNYSIPGVLKNALDWASRPPKDAPLKHKPIAIMGASTGQFGTARGQLALRQMFVLTNSYVLPKPEVLVFKAKDRFDAEGNLHDPVSKQLIQDLLEALVDWARRLSAT